MATNINSELNVGEASIKLLEAYGVDTVFGIPGVHTLEFCRGLNQSTIHHVQARNEQGAGFMADGYARASGKPGVALLISGPGVTNAMTAMGQAYADSIPMLVVSADAASHTLGKGLGCLHEVSSLTDATAPLTAFSATAMTAEEVPELFARAFSVFSSQRARPVHIAIPIDVLEMPATGNWEAIELPQRPEAGSELGWPYLRAFEEISVRYADVGDDGVFPVRSEDTLQVLDATGTILGEVRVRDVLNRAGVALLSSANATSTRYRFDPFWIHGHLIERYNQRTVADYGYRTCE